MTRRATSLAAALLLWGCAEHDHDGAHGHEHGEDASWAVTAWGKHFEIFAEADPLAVGEESVSHTHVTFLRDFSAVTEAAITAIFVGPDGSEAAFRQETLLRDGIFDVAMTPASEGPFELRFRVEAHGFTEDIPAGRVHVGTHDEPGGLVEVDASGAFVSNHDHDHGQDQDHDHDVPDQSEETELESTRESVAAAPQAEVVSFLKEQQWKTPFRTAWTWWGEIHQLVRGTGRVRPVAGSETALTASLDGEVAATQWPFVGMTVDAGAAVFELAPRAGEHRSLAELEARETETRAQLELATERLKRLQELIELQATSTAEVESARARVTALTAQHDAALRNLRAARGEVRSPSLQRGRVEILAPFAGQIAEVFVTPGEVVAAGATLAHVVQTEPFWVEVYLHPWEAALLAERTGGLLLRGPRMKEPVRFESARIRLVSRAPVVNDRTGTVTCIFEVQGTEPRLPLGTAVEAEVLLADTEIGIVVPASSIVDDAGVPIVYVQVDGESFVRRVVRVLSREGDRVLVDGLEANERLVTVGGPTIRRASLVSSDVGHGHVH